MTLVERIASHGDRTALVAAGARYTYADLEDRSRRIAAALLGTEPDLSEARVAFLVEPGIDYVALLAGVWRAGGVAVPLALSHPAAEIRHVLHDSGAAFVVASPDRFDRIAAPAGDGERRIVRMPRDLLAPAGTRALPGVSAHRRALMIYTSGTTGRPKGVVTTHANVAAQITSLVDAWEWSRDDRTLLVLPLHHVHGIINVVGCALWAGALCEMPPHSDAETTWERLASGAITVFTAVPTIYHRLIASWDAAGAAVQRARSAACARVRLMMSGSAALPVHVLERWRQITGHVLLERYGMTEIGMALANPLHGERTPGSVGRPLPGVEVRLVDEQGDLVVPGMPGEIEVRGPGVFLEYWRQDDATRRAFRDGWFRTGDMAVVDAGSYRLLGRASTDILKVGGHKVSALEIEEVLRLHPAISDCAVVGIDDPEWGHRVCVAVELRSGADLSVAALQGWARERLAPYKIPRALHCVPALPRNAMGKVVKPDVAARFASARPLA